MTTLRIKRGDDRTIRTPVFTQPGGTAPYPWLDSKAWFTAKIATGAPDSAAIIALDSDRGVDEIDLSTDGIALSKISGAKTRQLPNVETRLVFDLQVRNPNGEIFTVDSGELIIEAEVTLDPEAPTRTIEDRLLASVAELELFLDDSLDRARAEFFLTIAGGEVRAATGNDFTLTRDDVVLLDGKGSTVLLLPQAPVLDVLELVEAPGRSIEAILAGPETDRPAYEWNEDGILRRIDGKIFERRFRYYRATTDHGYLTTPDPVRGVVVRCAARAYENPEGTRQETLGRYSYTLAGEQAGIGLYGPDLRDLVPFGIGPGARLPTPSSTGSGS